MKFNISSPFVAEVKEGWSYTCAPQYAITVCTGTTVPFRTPVFWDVML
jgi:hypothetical protein